MKRENEERERKGVKEWEKRKRGMKDKCNNDVQSKSFCTVFFGIDRGSQIQSQYNQRSISSQAPLQFEAFVIL
jgi:hypothetical protein